MRLLCDVNVWIALLDDDHAFNDRARAVFGRRGLKIGTCPLVENAVARAAVPGAKQQHLTVL